MLVIREESVFKIHGKSMQKKIKNKILNGVNRQKNVFSH